MDAHLPVQLEIIDQIALERRVIAVVRLLLFHQKGKQTKAELLQSDRRVPVEKVQINLHEDLFPVPIVLESVWHILSFFCGSLRFQYSIRK